MLVKESLAYIDSDYTVDFRAFIASRAGTIIASQAADLMVGGSVGDGIVNLTFGSIRGMIRSVRVLSLQDTSWRVQFLERVVSAATPANLNQYGLLGSVDIYATGAVTNHGLSYGAIRATSYLSGTTFVYMADNLNIPYVEKSFPRATASGRLHVNLCNIGATDKSAGDVGAVHLRVGMISAA